MKTRPEFPIHLLRRRNHCLWHSHDSKPRYSRPRDSFELELPPCSSASWSQAVAVFQPSANPTDARAWSLVLEAHAIRLLPDCLSESRTCASCFCLLCLLCLLCLRWFVVSPAWRAQREQDCVVRGQFPRGSGSGEATPVQRVCWPRFLVTGPSSANGAKDRANSPHAVARPENGWGSCVRDGELLSLVWLRKTLGALVEVELEGLVVVETGGTGVGDPWGHRS
jgi:hypothetical protein